MSGDSLPERRDLRASHEDRDRAVELLRVAAGDGRLTADELDQRIETALSARTHGELELLVRDLPAAAGEAPAPDAKELVRLETRSGNIRRNGPWTVPRRMELRVRSGNAVLDLTEAVLTGPALDVTVTIRSGNLKLIVPRDVVVDLDDVTTKSGNVRQLSRLNPDAPVRLRIAVSGSVHSGNVTARNRRRGFWAWLTRRPLPA